MPDGLGKSAARLFTERVRGVQSRWYCRVAGCDGSPHEGMHWCAHPLGSEEHTWECRHARADQHPPAAFVKAEARIWLLMAGRGYGKLLARATPIPTPTGWSAIGDLQAGDTVFDEAGKPCRVTATYDEYPERAWRLKFSDGTEMLAGGEHQWVTWTHAERKAYLRSQHEPNQAAVPENWPQWRALQIPTRSLQKELVQEALRLYLAGKSIRSIARTLGCARQSLTPHLKAGRYLEHQAVQRANATGPQLRTTDDLVRTLTQGKREDRNHSIPLTAPLSLPDSVLPIDPYVLGAWLGDGSSAGAEITIGDVDSRETLQRLSLRGCTANGPGRHKPDSNCATYGIGRGWLAKALRETGVLGNKHIPRVYLRASAAQRLDLLRGLMDTDGWSGKTSQVEFTSTRRCLAEGVVELARSLGQKPAFSEGRATINGKDCGPKYRVTWRPTVQVFALRRKADRLTFSGAQNHRNTHRMIEAIEPIPVIPMRCITVDSPNSMYLAGEGMIPTHNTRTGAEWIADQAKNTPRSRWAAVAPTRDDVQEICFEGESGILAALGLTREYKGYNKSKLQLRLPNGAVIVSFSAAAPEKVRGPNLYGAYLEEIASWKDRTIWDNLLPAIRRGKAQTVIATTPKPVPLVREFSDRTDGSVAITTGSTFDNQHNLSAAAVAELQVRWKGTRRERQELFGELLADVPGALWTPETLELTRGCWIEEVAA